MKPKGRRWLLAAAAAGVLAASATRVAPLNSERERHKLLAAPIPESARPSMMLTPMLALGRAPLVDYLWLRATKLKDNGQFYDAYQLSQLICDLQPRFASVWAFQAWNMAYNISVTLDTPEERWRWVRNGYELLRDKGIPLNPGNTQLYRELAWIFFHKIGDWTDEQHNYYKLQLALIIEDALGKPPEGWVRQGRNEGDYYRSYDYQPLADAPHEWVDAARGEGVHALDMQLQKFGFDISKPGVYLGILNGLREGNLAIPGSAPGDEANQLHALREVMANPELAGARHSVESFWRASTLRNELKIEPQRLLEIQEQIGGIILDLRVPWTHALYWSIMGLQKGTDKKVLLDTNKLNTNRTEFFCLTKLFFFGRMQMSAQAKMGEPPLFMPDIRFAEILFDTYLRESNQYEFDKTNKEPVGRDFFSGFVGITRTIALRYAELGFREKAEEKYEFLKKHYPDPIYGASLDDFLMAQAKADRENPDFRTAMSRMCRLIDRGLIQYAYDEDEEGMRFIARAKQVYDAYQAALVSNRNRVEGTFAEIVEARCHLVGGTMYRATYVKVCEKMGVTPLPERDGSPTTAPGE